MPIARKIQGCGASAAGGTARHSGARLERQPAARANEVWGMDFVADQLADGRKLRTLTIVDLLTRECLGIEVGFSLRAGGSSCCRERGERQGALHARPCPNPSARCKGVARA